MINIQLRCRKDSQWYFKVTAGKWIIEDSRGFGQYDDCLREALRSLHNPAVGDLAGMAEL